MKSNNALSGLSMAVVLHFGVLAGSAQTNKYLFSGSETNITLNPGTYIITAYGAHGGGQDGKLRGGVGAEMSAEFSFPASTTLTLLVGGGGVGGFGGGGVGSGGGGGGGSFVVEGGTPLVIAGGGGGVGSNGGDNGSVSTNGDGANSLNIPGIPVGAGDGGTNGGGGTGGIVRYYQAGPPFYLSGAGGGTSGNGVINDGGGSFETGGNGGTYGNGYGADYYGAGGYGGGGAGGGGALGGGAGGGGGGYSGGGGGNVYDGYAGAGGGGGSIIDSSAIADLAEVSGVASPDDATNGEVIITAVPTPLAIVTGAVFGFTNGVFCFNVTGPSGSNVVIQASTDLQTWIPLQTNLLATGPLHFSDAQSSANVRRFYRVQLSP